MLSVICPIYNEEKYIGQCIESIVKQDYPKKSLEIIFVDGMSNDHTLEIINTYIEQYPFIKVLSNPKRIVPCAMNIGVKVAKGDVIIRLDAHANYQPDYFSKLVEGLEKYKADNIGVVCKTDVLNKNPKSLAIREVLSNKLGVGNSTFRTGIKEAQEVDTVPFGCWRKSVFNRFGYYDERLIRNQDIELNKRILRGGGKIVIIPDTYCTYLARENYRALAKNNYGNGKWNILTLFYTKQLGSLSLRHFIPLIFILSLIIPTVLGFIWWPFWILSGLSLISYMALLGYESLRLHRERQLSFVYLLSTFIVLHFSYGWGSLIALLKLPFTKR